MKKKDYDFSELTQVIHKGEFAFPDGCEVSSADMPDHEAKHGFTSTRRASYHGKDIEIQTTYKILIDGKPVQSHATAMDNGRVHTHAMPQYAFSSAIGLAKALVRLSEINVPEDELASTTDCKENQ